MTGNSLQCTFFKLSLELRAEPYCLMFMCFLYSVVQSVVAHIKTNDVANPFGFLFEERNRQKLINPNIQWLVGGFVCRAIRRHSE